jgi:hypothetical protein
MADPPTEPIPPGGGWGAATPAGAAGRLGNATAAETASPTKPTAVVATRLGRRPDLGSGRVRGWRGCRWCRRRAGAPHGDGDLDRHLHRAGQHHHHDRATHHDRAGAHHHGQDDHHDPTAQAGTTTTQRRVTTTTKAPTRNCDPSYPDFCIPPPPPDLNCADIGETDFTVQGADPHGFDGDHDGVGCES